LASRRTGIGIDEKFIPKIFDPFSQEDGSRSNKYGSTGLGMDITKNIVELMNGTITVESEKGVGTEVTVTVTLTDTDVQKSIPIIALTANAFDEDVQRSLQAGMNAHLSKPVDPEHLYQTLEELIWEAQEKQ